MSALDRKCLVIDDSSFDNRMMCHIAESIGFNVSHANNAQDGLAYCRRNIPDVIFLDWQMPEMDGIKFLETLRKRQEGKHIAVLMCTSKEQVSDVAEAIQAGANSYIIKPFYKKKIMQKLRELYVL